MTIKHTNSLPVSPGPLVTSCILSSSVYHLIRVLGIREVSCQCRNEMGLNDEIVEYEARELHGIRKIETTFTEPFHVVCLQWLELFFAKDYHFLLTAS